MMLLAPCLLLAVSTLSLATQLDLFTDHVDISQAFVQGELLPGTATMETSIFHLHRVMTKILDIFIASSSHFMACRQPLVRGIRQ